MNTMQDDFLETSDLDQDIQKRKELIGKAKEINFEGEEREIIRQIADLQKQWRRISYWDSAYEQSLEQEFEGHLNVFFSKRREDQNQNKESKEELIAQAKVALKQPELTQATQKMNELFELWKKMPTAGKNQDDVLWEEFNKIRQEFYARKEKNWQDTQKRMENAEQVKLQLIEEAKNYVESENWKETSAKFQSFLDQWKKVGGAGRDKEEDLWNQFNDLRQKFYNRKEEYFQHIREVEAINYEKKKGIVEQAKEILEAQNLGKESTEKMKELGNLWKNIGFAGKDKDNVVWKQFREMMDTYFDRLKKDRDQKQIDWRQRMMETRARKVEMINSQKNRLKRMQDGLIGVISEREMNDMKEDMDDRKEFIAQLEAELEELDKKLAE